MKGGKVFLTTLVALALMGLVWVGIAAASGDGSSFGQGKVKLGNVIQDSHTDADGPYARELMVMPSVAVTPTVTPTSEELHPVAMALATFYDVPYEEIIKWHEDGIGFGNIAKAYALFDELEDKGLTVDDMMEELSDTGWGQVKKAYGLSPSSKGKNLGQVMSGYSHDDDDDDDEPEEALSQADKHPGRGHGPPKKDKDKIPPGHNKDKTPPGQEKKNKNKENGHGQP
jgi:hypothetical protein